MIVGDGDAAGDAVRIDQMARFEHEHTAGGAVEAAIPGEPDAGVLHKGVKVVADHPHEMGLKGMNGENAFIQARGPPRCRKTTVCRPSVGRKRQRIVGRDEVVEVSVVKRTGLWKVGYQHTARSAGPHRYRRSTRWDRHSQSCPTHSPAPRG